MTTNRYPSDSRFVLPRFMSETPSPQEAFQEWTEHLQTPDTTVADIRRLIAYYVAPFAQVSSSMGVQLEADLYVRARMSLACVNLLQAVKDECAEIREQYRVRLKQLQEPPESPIAMPQRKVIRNRKRRPQAYR